MRTRGESVSRVVGLVANALAFAFGDCTRVTESVIEVRGAKLQAEGVSESVFKLVIARVVEDRV